MKRIEASRAERVAQGLPPDGDDSAATTGSSKPGQEEVDEADDAEVMAVSAPVDSRGRPISNPTQFLYHKNRVIVDVEAKRKKHRTVYGEAVVVGAGGLPVMSTARALCLMSGGIDSPVAAYQMMTRGCRVAFVHFLNSTSDTAAILAKLHLIAKRLSILQGRLDLRLVDISELQNAIIGTVNKTDRTVVYKQYMLLLAAAIPGFEILVTGDSVAQVASQTIANIATLYPLTPRSVVSPLSGMNKNDVIDTSRRIGLLDYSAMEGADCCQYLMCKTGANLCIGKAKMQRYLSQIHVDSVPVKVVAFDRGEEIPSAERTEYIPFQSVVVNMPVPVGDQLGDLVARLHPRAAKREEALQAAVANGGTFAPHKSGRASDGGMSAEARARIEQMMGASAPHLAPCHGGCARGVPCLWDGRSLRYAHRAARSIDAAAAAVSPSQWSTHPGGIIATILPPHTRRGGRHRCSLQAHVLPHQLAVPRRRRTGRRLRREPSRPRCRRHPECRRAVRC
jgi:hypothetical protein